MEVLDLAYYVRTHMVLGNEHKGLVLETLFDQLIPLPIKDKKDPSDIINEGKGCDNMTMMLIDLRDYDLLETVVEEGEEEELI